MRLAQKIEISGLVDIDLATHKWNRDDRAGWIEKQSARARIAHQSKQLLKCCAGKDRGNAEGIGVA